MPVCVVILAAGEGHRLRPLTTIRPKALCPVGNVPLLERALGAAAALGFAGPDQVAVNAWHHADAIVSAVGGRVHLSVEAGPAPLGSAGGLAALRDWIGGRDVLVGNADAYLSGGSIEPLLIGWDATGVRMLGVRAGIRHVAEFGVYRFAGFSLLPWHMVAALPVEHADLVRTVWRPAEAAGALDVIDYCGTYIDTGTPGDYLSANLHAIGSAPALVEASAVVTGAVRRTVVGADAVIRGYTEECVVWPGAVVNAGERLVRAIRYGPDPAQTVRLA